MSSKQHQGGSSGTPQGSERPLWSFPADGNSEWGTPDEMPQWAQTPVAFEAPPADLAPGPPEPEKKFGERQAYAGRSKRTGPRGDSASRGTRGSRNGTARSTGTKRERPAAEPVELSDEQYATKGRAILLRQLTASSKSRAQLLKKLLEKEIPVRIAEELLDRFEEIQLVDDNSFAESWVRARARSRGLARSAIRRELRGKGIEGDMAENALEQLDEESEEATAKDLVDRKLRAPSMGVDKDKSVRRLVGMLARKGYSPSMAFRIANEAWEEHYGQEPY
ncbi:regulatory protein RecX [Paeniglutamicibacter kerguelensis]|uniref:Regulatory protein RecX n=1 Tax=Paeniglutamicibacter kerguelensis TaxID=254788 RepID=A0ABS4X9S5_9MICC|nr:regulatory protein [Paeniglutamicibacter kerguelensis]